MAVPLSSRRKVRAAALSVLSNSVLILAKVVAGTVTGSVAILTEAVHSRTGSALGLPGPTC